MHDPRLVCRGKRARCLDYDIDDLSQFHLLALHKVAKCPALDIFAHNIMRAFDFADLEDRQYIWMIERRCRFCFLNEPANVVRVAVKSVVQYLDGNKPVELVVARKIYDAHPAFADLPYYF